jgi:hypothetical protein
MVIKKNILVTTDTILVITDNILVTTDQRKQIESMKTTACILYLL